MSSITPVPHALQITKRLLHYNQKSLFLKMGIMYRIYLNVYKNISPGAMNKSMSCHMLEHAWQTFTNRFLSVRWDQLAWKGWSTTSRCPGSDYFATETKPVGEDGNRWEDVAFTFTLTRLLERVSFWIVLCQVFCLKYHLWVMTIWTFSVGPAPISFILLTKVFSAEL